MGFSRSPRFFSRFRKKQTIWVVLDRFPSPHLLHALSHLVFAFAHLCLGSLHHLSSTSQVPVTAFMSWIQPRQDWLAKPTRVHHLHSTIRLTISDMWDPTLRELTNNLKIEISWSISLSPHTCMCTRGCGQHHEPVAGEEEQLCVNSSVASCKEKLPQKHLLHKVNTLCSLNFNTFCNLVQAQGFTSILSGTGWVVADIPEWASEKKTVPKDLMAFIHLDSVCACMAVRSYNAWIKTALSEAVLLDLVRIPVL